MIFCKKHGPADCKYPHCTCAQGSVIESQLRTITEAVQYLAGNDFLYLDGPIKVQRSPHSHAFYAWAIAAIGGKIIVMDRDKNAIEISEDLPDYSLVIATIQQRLGYIMNKLNQKAAS